MKKRFLIRLLTLAFAAAALLSLSVPTLAAQQTSGVSYTEEERAFLSKNSVLRVGFVQDRPPVSFTGPDGSLKGISRYIFDELARLMDVEFEYVPLPPGQITYDYLVGAKLDFVTSVERNPENQSARGILLSEPYLKCLKVIVAKEGLDSNTEEYHRVAVSSGSQTIHKVLSRVYPNFEFVDYESVPACFEAVRTGACDMTIINQYVAEYWFGKPVYDHLKSIPALSMDEELCFSSLISIEDATGPSRERGEKLIAILNKAIAALDPDFVSSVSIRAAMENQYEQTFPDFLYRYRVLAAVLAVAAAAILALAILLSVQCMRSAEAKAGARAKDSFLSAMSHEIRTPLNGLLGLNYLMEQNAGDQQRVSEYLRQSNTTTKYLLRIVNDVLDLSQIQEHRLELELAPVDMEELLHSIRAVTDPLMAEKRLTFTLEYSLPYPYVEGDAARIEQVVMNLLDNAAKFTPEGGRVALRASQSGHRGDTAITSLTVIDTGRGISDEFKERLFNAFNQDLGTVSKGNQGMGLGLTISHRLASLMGGNITFESEKGQGSTFTFTFSGKILPKPAPEPVPEPAEAAPAQPAARDPMDSLVLIAEDNELNREIMTELLEEAGFKTVSAEDGQEALDIFRASEPGSIGTVLMDLLMPRMDGYEASRAIRALPREDAKTVRIIACTANTLSEDRRRAMESGMDEFIPKPVNVGDLMDKLSS